MADQAGVEDGVQLGAVGAGAAGAAADGAARGGGQGCRAGGAGDRVAVTCSAWAVGWHSGRAIPHRFEKATCGSCRSLELDRTAARRSPCSSPTRCGPRRRAGALRAGDRLPSTRALAVDLGVSRTVTAAAYDQLLAEGWVAGRRGAGTFVVAVPAPRGPRPRHVPTPRSDRARAPSRTGAESAGPAPAPVRTCAPRAGMPCVAALDRAAWRRAWRAAADEPPDVVPDAVGLPAFRTARSSSTCCGTAACPPIPAPCWRRAAPRRRSPSWPAPCPRGAGGGGGAGLPARRRGAARRRARRGSGAGGRRRAGRRRAAGGLVAAVYCTPAHQFPLGARLSAARRVALVARARAEGFLVVEDDYDGELRYDVAPLPLLAALGPDVVAHLGTASKLLTPTLGVGWLVAPPAVRAAVLDLRDRAGARPARAGQRVFAALAAHGDLGPAPAPAAPRAGAAAPGRGGGGGRSRDAGVRRRGGCARRRPARRPRRGGGGGRGGRRPRGRARRTGPPPHRRADGRPGSSSATRARPARSSTARSGSSPPCCGSWADVGIRLHDRGIRVHGRRTRV